MRFIRLLLAVLAVIGVAAVLTMGLELGALVMPFIVGVFAVAIVVGAWMCWTASDRETVKANLGPGLVVSALIAGVVFAAQARIDNAQQNRADQKDRFDLALTFQQDLHGIDLHRRFVQDFYLRRKDFRDSNLNHAHFERSDLTGAKLSGGDTNLEGIHLEDALLGHADLREARMFGADLSNATLDCSRIGGADLTRASLSETTVQEADLSNATLSNASLRSADLTYSDLRAVDAIRLHARDIVLYGADMREGDFSGSDFRGADLRGADLRGSVLTRTLLAHAQLGGAYIDESTVWPSGYSVPTNVIQDRRPTARHSVPCPD